MTVPPLGGDRSQVEEIFVRKARERSHSGVDVAHLVMKSVTKFGTVSTLGRFPNSDVSTPNLPMRCEDSAGELTNAGLLSLQQLRPATTPVSAAVLPCAPIHKANAWGGSVQGGLIRHVLRLVSVLLLLSADAPR